MTIQRSNLASGIRVVTDHMPHVETAAVQVLVGAGARNETADQHGMSHLLEHMAFKGTKRRNALAIAEEIEQVGGDLNAATSHETTTYYARVLKEDVGLAIDILADILVDSVFDATELAREQNVIVQEIGAAHDAPDDLVHDLLQEAAFGDQPLGRPILGTAETVRRASPADLKTYLGTHYHAPNIVVAAAGAVDHDAIVREVETRFAALPMTVPAPADAASYIGGDRRATRDLEQFQLALAFAAPSYLDDDFYAARIAAIVLGGSMSSRLFQEVRERRGLCYSVYAYLSSYRDAGLFGIAAATAPETAPELLEAIAAELRRATGDVTRREVDRTRAQAKAGILMTLESASARAEQIGRQTLIYDRVFSTGEVLDRLGNVDAAKVQTIIGGLADAAASMATVGPAVDLGTAARFRETLY